MTTPIVFAPRIFTIPTPRHASQTPEEIQKAFITLLAASRAAQLAIKQAAQGQCVLVVNPSRNPNANAVFHAVLASMISWHRAQVAAEPAAEPETTVEPLTEAEAEPAVTPMSKQPSSLPPATPMQVVEIDPEELAALNGAAELAEFEAAFMTP